MRINKYLTTAKFCSRREADRLIIAGKVKINNRLAKLGDQVETVDEVFVNGQEIFIDNQYEYLILNKPVGYIVTTDRAARDNVMDLLPHIDNLFPVGRLDVESGGLLLLSNDGSIVNKLLKSASKVEKEYLVDLDRPLAKDDLTKLMKGVYVDGTKTIPAKVFLLGGKRVSITITQGMNRQVRKMCEAVGYKVIKLSRVRIGEILLSNLKVGMYRKLNKEELQWIKSL